MQSATIPAIGQEASIQSVDVSEQMAVRGRRIGVTVLAVFGGLWLAGGCSLSGAGIPIYLCIAAVAVAMVIAVGRVAATPLLTPDRLRSDPLQVRRGRIFHWINGAQWVAAAALIAVLNVVHHPEWIMAGIMLIVGLHFLPLARLFNHRPHVWLGVALSGWAIAYPLILAQGPTSPWGPIGAGLILWAAGLAALAVLAQHRPGASNG